MGSSNLPHLSAFCDFLSHRHFLIVWQLGRFYFGPVLVLVRLPLNWSKHIVLFLSEKFRFEVDKMTAFDCNDLGTITLLEFY